MELEKYVVSNPQVMMEKPVIAGTRIPVELILEKLAAGETVEQVLQAHPRLTPIAHTVFNASPSLEEMLEKFDPAIHGGEAMPTLQILGAEKITK
jgi:hypothetical protein